MRARSRQGDDETHARIFPQSDRVPDHLWNVGNTVQRANANDSALDNRLWRVGDESGLNNNGKALALLLANRAQARLFPRPSGSLRPRARKTSCQAMRV